MIYTSYYQNLELRQTLGKYCMIQISSYTPTRFPDIAKLPELFPSNLTLKAFKENGNLIEFANRYYAETLSSLDPNEIVEVINLIAGNQTPVLMCQQRMGQISHRHIVASWLRYHGIDCEELVYNDADEHLERIWYRRNRCSVDSLYKRA